MRWNGTKGRRQLFSWRQRRESAEALTSQPRTAGRRAHAEEWRSWMLLGPTQWIVPSQLSFAGCGLPPHSDAYNIACYLHSYLSIFMELKPDVAAFLVFLFCGFWVSCVTLFFLSPSLPPSLLSFSHCLSPFPLSVSFFLSRSPPSPLISLTLSRSSSLSPPLSSFFSLSLCSFYILCWMLSSLNCLSIFYTLYFLSVLSAETFLAQYSVQHFICNPHAEWGSNLLFRIWRASLLCIFCVCVCARVSECDFSRMGCNQNTITLKSRAQDHQGRDATLRAWDEDVRMELTREVFG